MSVSIFQFPSSHPLATNFFLAVHYVPTRRAAACLGPSHFQHRKLCYFAHWAMGAHALAKPTRFRPMCPSHFQHRKFYYLAQGAYYLAQGGSGFNLLENALAGPLQVFLHFNTRTFVANNTSISKVTASCNSQLAIQARSSSFNQPSSHTISLSTFLYFSMQFTLSPFCHTAFPSIFFTCSLLLCSSFVVLLFFSPKRGSSIIYS